MKKRVLVVDDDRLVADTLKLVFDLNGYETEASYTAAEGLERARSFGPELVLCDVSLPGENGLDLVAAIDRELPRCKVLMLTAYASHAAAVEDRAQSMSRPLKMLRKPCRPEELLREATEMLRSA